MRQLYLPAILCVCMILLFSLPCLVSADALKLPRTGQTQCYDSNGNMINCTGTGQDGETQMGESWPDPRFTIIFCDGSGPCANQGSDCDADSTNDVVQDELTGLMWTRDATPFLSQHWQDALAKTEALNLGGYTDWRMSNINELHSLVHYGFNEEDCSGSSCTWLRHWLGKTFVEMAITGLYWTSTTYVAQKYNAWVMNTLNGSIAGYNKGDGNPYAWPVRGGANRAGRGPGGAKNGSYSCELSKTGQNQCYDNNGNALICTDTGQDGDYQYGVGSNSPRFVDNNDGTVTDLDTLLVWLKDFKCFGQMDYDDACNNVQSICQGTTPQTCVDDPQSYPNMRIPNAVEARSIMDYQNSFSALPAGASFINTDINHIHISTSDGKDPDKAWAGNPQDGGMVSTDKDDATPYLVPVWTYEPPVISETRADVPNTASVKCPISTATGELFSTEAPDLKAGGIPGLGLVRYYASLLTANGDIQSALKNNWMHNFDLKISVSGSEATVVYYGGETIPFTKNSTWSLKEAERVIYQLVESGPNYLLMDPISQRVYTFNSSGRLTRIEDRNQNALILTYSGDLLDQVSDGLGRTLKFSYDGLNRLTGVANQTKPSPPYPTVTFTYDGDNLETVVDTLGKTTNYSYTTKGSFVGLLTLKERPGGNTHFAQTWDDSGRVASQTTSGGHATGLAYDGDDQLETVQDPLGKTTILAYDELQRPKIVTNPLSETTTLGYNSRGWATTQTDPAGKTFTTEYDKEGVVSGVTNPLNQSWSFATDKLGRIIQKTTPLLRTTGYAYDSMGRLTSLTDPLSRTTNFGYDAQGLLTGITLPGAISSAYTRNALGRITRITDPLGNFWDRTYDEMGRLTSSKDPLLNQTAYTYNNRNQVSFIDLPSSDVTLFYDANGNIERRLYSDSTDLNYSYDKNDRLLTADNVTMAYDARGNITDSNGLAGTLTDSYAVTPYGRVTGRTGTTDNPFVFIGAYGVMQEGDTGLYYMRARYYDSMTGRFISKDPLKSIHPKSINPYQYAVENPKQNIDPSGLDIVDDDFPVKLTWDGYYRFRVRYIHDETTRRVRDGDTTFFNTDNIEFFDTRFMMNMDMEIVEDIHIKANFRTLREAPNDKPPFGGVEFNYNDAGSPVTWGSDECILWPASRREAPIKIPLVNFEFTIIDLPQELETVQPEKVTEYSHPASSVKADLSGSYFAGERYKDNIVFDEELSINDEDDYSYFDHEYDLRSKFSMTENIYLNTRFEIIVNHWGP